MGHFEEGGLPSRGSHVTNPGRSIDAGKLRAASHDFT